MTGSPSSHPSSDTECMGRMVMLMLVQKSWIDVHLMHRQECVGFYSKWHLLITSPIVLLLLQPCKSTCRACTPTSNPSGGSRAAHGRTMRSIKPSKGVRREFLRVGGRWEQLYVRTTPPPHTCRWQGLSLTTNIPRTDNQYVTIIGWNNSLLARRWRRADGKSTFFPMPGHFIFKMIISSIIKVNWAIGYLKCQNP